MIRHAKVQYAFKHMIILKGYIQDSYTGWPIYM